MKGGREGRNKGKRKYWREGKGVRDKIWERERIKREEVKREDRII